VGIEVSLFTGLFGLIIGSFLNVVIYRVPRGESIVFPGSHCTSCGHELKAWELIPVLSFLFLGRSCSKCGERISWRYPLIELLTGLLFFYAAWQSTSGSWSALGSKLVFIAVLIVLAGIDFDTFRLPDIFTVPLLIFGLFYSIFLPGDPTGWESFLSALSAGGFFGLIAWFYPKGMGLGDVKLIAGLGAFLGFPEVFLAIFIASLLGSMIGLSKYALKQRGFREEIPFGPYLVLGAIIALFWGNRLIEFYFSLL